jgi:hypothetical protein
LEGWKIGRLGTALSSLPIFPQQLPVQNHDDADGDTNGQDGQVICVEH